MAARGPGSAARLAAALDDVSDLELRPLVANTSPAHALQATAEQEQAGIIVVGSSHTGRLGRVLPGSTAERLLHGAGALGAAEELARALSASLRVMQVIEPLVRLYDTPWAQCSRRRPERRVVTTVPAAWLGAAADDDG